LKLLLDRQFRETLGVAARERALTEFSQDRITREFAEFYKEVLVG
jgi:glycosyltransferase involved in cell wall biosynthesis